MSSTIHPCARLHSRWLFWLFWWPWLLWKGTARTRKRCWIRIEPLINGMSTRPKRSDLGETLLEIGLVVTSVTLLTKSRIYWYFGIVFALAGIASALSAFLLH